MLLATRSACRLKIGECNKRHVWQSSVQEHLLDTVVEADSSIANALIQQFLQKRKFLQAADQSKQIYFIGPKALHKEEGETTTSVVSACKQDLLDTFQSLRLRDNMQRAQTEERKVKGHLLWASGVLPEGFVDLLCKSLLLGLDDQVHH